MNYAKIAMLHRMYGAKPILIYASPQEEDAKSLYRFLQSLCNGSSELELRENSILCRNPFLALHLQEEIREQKLVPQSDLSIAVPGTASFL